MELLIILVIVWIGLFFINVFACATFTVLGLLVLYFTGAFKN